MQMHSVTSCLSRLCCGKTTSDDVEQQVCSIGLCGLHGVTQDSSCMAQQVSFICIQMLRRRPTNPSILAWKVVACLVYETYCVECLCTPRIQNTSPHVKSKQWRGKSLHALYTKYIAARKIQTIWRGTSLHGYYQKYNAARKIQALWRGTSLHGDFQKYIAARDIQTLGRRFVSFMAARRIQTMWRGSSMHRQYKDFLVAECAFADHCRTTNFVLLIIQTMLRGKSIYQNYRFSRLLGRSKRCGVMLR
jgi:hypothetical protein